ncbi:MAG TPA: energy-coupled thiamine transporter ThiT [Lachnospiraceae bacterium]|nr:energy-coupled thiamine transporter ThiT [Lachnospiraceae bacterium]
MLYNVITDGDDISYLPTPLGTALLIVLFLALLAAAVAFAGKKSSSGKRSSSERNSNPERKNASGSESRLDGTAAPGKKSGLKLGAKQLAFCAVAVALGTVLSNLKLYEFPFGGSITLLSMLFICLPGYWFGLEAGVITGVAYGILQLIIDPYVIHPAQLLVDYPLAFGAFGLSGLFTDKKNGLLKGYAAGIIGRWIFATLSGWIFFAEYAWEGWSPLPYSLVYNGIYIFSEAAITLIILAIPQVRAAFARVKKLALE